MNCLPDPEPVFPILETERLLMREFNFADVPVVFEMYTWADINERLNHEPIQAIEEAEERVSELKSCTM